MRSGLFTRLAAGVLLSTAAWLVSPPTVAADSAASANAERRVLGRSIDGPVAASLDPQVRATLSELRTKVQAKQRVRVIVGVRASFAPEGYLSAAGVKAQRAEIAAAQGHVSARLSERAARSARHFKSIPFMALVVDADELEALAGSLEVTDLQEDAIDAPSLAESVPLLRADVAWSHGYTGAGWAIAVLDTGVDKTHPFLAGKVASEACYSSTIPHAQASSLCPGGASESTAPGSGANCDSSIEFCHHGTHVAGIAAGFGDALPGAGYSGVARNARIVAIQVFSRFDDPADCGGTVPCARVYQSDVIRGLEHVLALSGSTAVASVTMSLGGGRFVTRADCDTGNLALKEAIDNLRSVGVAAVASSGNEGYIDGVNRPACVSTAIGVGNTLDAPDVPGSNDCAGHLGGPMATDAVACSSNTAAYLDLLAPGTRITSSMPGGTYAGDSGTSMAAPHVAGCVALIREAHPTLTVDQIIETLRNTGKPVTDWRSPSISTPRIDCGAAVLAPNPALLSFAASPTSLTIDDPIELTATVTNNGLTASAPTTIHYMQQIGSTWSQVCTGSVEALAPGASTVQRCVHRPPSTPGTYFYNVWIGSVPGESLRGDNFSGTVKATVSGALANTSTALDAPINSGVFGQSVTFTATVTGSSPTGSVTFKDGTTTLCDAIALTGGSATCTTAALEVGTHAVSATYGGNVGNAGSISPTLTYAVAQAATRTSITAHSPNPSAPGTPVTVAANVTVEAPGAGVPSGTITVSDGTANCVIALPAASCSLTPATAGTKAITASYGGDAHFIASESADVGHSVTPGGVGVGVVEYPVSTTNPGPIDIALGPDGNLWFTEVNGSSIGRITPAGVITEFYVTSGPPIGITAGPDGNLWFTQIYAGRIGRMTTSGDVAYFYTPTRNSWPGNITTGPDGNLWFTEVYVNKIGRITPAGVITEYPVSAVGPVDLSGIAKGPDGNLWFTLVDSYKIGRITPTGLISYYTVPTPHAQPSAISAGPDGNLWFVEDIGKIGRITTSGAITEFPIPGYLDEWKNEWSDIAAGPDGNVWFALGGGNRIGKITPGGVITQYLLPTPNSRPVGITTGPDGNLWFAEVDGSRIGVITPAGIIITEHWVPPKSSGPSFITAGPDGNLWFTEETGNRIGKITPAGVLTEYVLPGASEVLPAVLQGITAGPDGNVWFAEAFGNKIGRITPTGAITEFPVLTPNASPVMIVTGPDGNLWFTEDHVDKIGRITPNGVVTEFPLTPHSGPKGITVGADGNLWFTEDSANKIGRITTAGVVTEFALPSPDSEPNYGIALGPDGNVWFTEDGGNRIGRITPAGVITEFPVPTPAALQGIAAGPDGNLWFTEALGNRIGRITTAGVITEFPLPTPESPALLGIRTSGPIGIAKGPDGRMWFAEVFANKIGRFDPFAPPILVSVSVVGPGRVISEPSGIDCGGTCEATFTLGSTIALNAVAASGSTFAGWSGDCGGATVRCDLTLGVPKNLTATFLQDPAFPSGGQPPSGWTTPPGADATWGVASDQTSSGPYSMKSTPIGNGQVAAVRTSGTYAAGTVWFAYSVSSEPTYDLFEFYIDGQLVLSASGTVPWTDASYPVPAGAHTFEWVYRKNEGGSVGADAVWIDSVVVPPPGPPASPSVTTSAPTSIGATGATLAGSASGNGASTTVTFQYGPTTAYGSTSTAVQSPLPADASNSSVSSTIGGLGCNTRYHYRAVAANGAGTANGGDATFVTTACVPPAPTIGMASLVPGTSTAMVTWTAPSSDGGSPITGYTITSNPGSLTGSAGPAATSGTVAGLSAGVAYTFAVTARSSAGVGAASPSSNAVTPMATSPPTLVGASSRKVHGAAGTFDLPLSSTPTTPTTEPRSGGAGGNHTIVFVFDKPVTAGNASVTSGTGTAGTPTFGGNEMRVPLSGVTNQQYVTVSVSEVVAADGGIGGTGSVRVGFLLGDVSQNRVVTVSDLAQVNAQIAQVVTASNYLKDVNASGTLTVADKGIANTQITKALPAP